MSMDLTNKNIGIAITGSYCTYKKVFAELEKLAATGANLYSIFSDHACTTNGISDTPVLMAAKAHLRNNRPLVVSLSTNDALGMNLKNIGILLNTKNIYFIPFGQDNYKAKPNSMIAHIELLTDTIEEALASRQLQPVIQGPYPK